MPSPRASASATFSQARFEPRARAGRGAGAGSTGAGAGGATGIRGSFWHFGHRSVPSGRLAQQDRQNIGRGCGAGLS